MYKSQRERSNMLTEERWSAILELVEKEKAISVTELEKELGVSASTIRRDLTQLHMMGKLLKVHGGATSIGTQYVNRDLTMDEKYTLYSEEKRRIAEFAANLIAPTDFVYIDAGTTTEMLVECIKEHRATYVTNSMANALKLVRKGCKVFLPGGEIKNSTEAIVGADAIDYLRRLHFTIGFFGTNGISPEVGFTTPDPNEAMIKRLAIGHSKKKYILSDRSKFQIISPVTFASFDSATVITDSIPDQKYKKYENIVEVGK